MPRKSRFNPVEDGMLFQRWLVLDSFNYGTKNHPKALCSCSCGTIRPVTLDALRSGKSKSCGCYRDEKSSVANTTHGLRSLKVYPVWVQMNQRTTNPNHEWYVNYGGRGIVVCPRWKSFDKFYADMGDPPFKGATIERRDNNGPYSPENCVWATRAEQGRNKRTNNLITFKGRTQCIQVWMSELNPSLGLVGRTLNTRLVRGWTVEEAFTTGRLSRRDSIARAAKRQTAELMEKLTTKEAA